MTSVNELDIMWQDIGYSIDHTDNTESIQKVSGLDWEAVMSPVMYAGPNEIATRYPQQNVLWNSDTGIPLGMVSDSYNVVQPKTILEMYSKLAESQDYHLSVAGSMNDGKIVWAMADTNLETVLNGQTISGKILMATSYDGKLPTLIKFIGFNESNKSTIPVQLTSNQIKSQIKAKHKTNFDYINAVNIIKKSEVIWDEFQEAMDIMTTDMTSEETSSIIIDTFTTKGERDILTFDDLMGKRKVKDVLNMIYERGNITADNILWSTCRYIDYDIRKSDQESRLQSAWFGKGELLKQYAYNSLKEKIHSIL